LVPVTQPAPAAPVNVTCGEIVFDITLPDMGEDRLSRCDLLFLAGAIYSQRMRLGIFGKS
jgi:hypothetical protein